MFFIYFSTKMMNKKRSDHLCDPLNIELPLTRFEPICTEYSRRRRHEIQVVPAGKLPQGQAPWHPPRFFCELFMITQRLLEVAHLNCDRSVDVLVAVDCLTDGKCSCMVADCGGRVPGGSVGPTHQHIQVDSAASSTFRVEMSRISRRPGSAGGPILIDVPRRPARRRAGSICSALFVAARRTTASLSSIPCRLATGRQRGARLCRTSSRFVPVLGCRTNQRRQRWVRFRVRRRTNPHLRYLCQ